MISGREESRHRNKYRVVWSIQYHVICRQILKVDRGYFCPELLQALASGVAQAKVGPPESGACARGLGLRVIGIHPHIAAFTLTGL